MENKTNIWFCIAAAARLCIWDGPSVHVHSDGLILSSSSLSWSSSVCDLGAFTNEQFEWTESVQNPDWFIWIFTWDQRLIVWRIFCVPSLFGIWIVFRCFRRTDEWCLMFAMLFIWFLCVSLLTGECINNVYYCY